MGGLINAFMTRKWLTITGVILVIVAILQPSKGLGVVLVVLGGALIVVQTVIRVTVSLRSRREANVRKATS
jgi:uncharacterized membrane protein HdeD (DUF308 family)